MQYYTSVNYNIEYPNDCSTCQSGSYGTCAADEVDCVTLPWNRDDFCRGDNYFNAGVNGCVNCPNIRSICATSCNWCTPNGFAITTTTTTTKPTTYSVYTRKILNLYYIM